MPEELKVDCFECKDLEFARNLARQMKEGYGRHNSNLAFRAIEQWPEYLTEAMSQRMRERSPFFRENQQARVIGRLGDNAVRERWQDCEIGDAVPEGKMPQITTTMAKEYGSRYIVMRTPRPFVSRVQPAMEPHMRQETDIRFEKVRHTVTSDGGYHWHEETLWKRIE